MTLLAERSTVATAAPALVAISHGTHSPAGQRAVARLVEAVARTREDLTVTAGFVDVQQPDVAATLSPIDGPAVVIPLLLSAGYHVHVDLRNELRGHPASELARALGPDDRLTTVLERRLIEAGLESDDAIVLACAGSSDPRAVADCHEMGRRLERRLGRPVTVSFISAAFPRVDEAVTMQRSTGARVVVSTYLLAPGYFADLARAAGADVTAAPLLLADEAAPSELVALVIDRYAGE